MEEIILTKTPVKNSILSKVKFTLIFKISVNQ
jgi:hypothetical protein